MTRTQGNRVCRHRFGAFQRRSGRIVTYQSRPGVVMDISPRIISVYYIRIHFGYEPGTHIQNALRKRRRGYIYPVRQKHQDYIGSVSQIRESGYRDIYGYEASRTWRILVKCSRSLFSRADKGGINVRTFGSDKRRSSPTRVEPFNHATRPDCVVVRV